VKFPAYEPPAIAAMTGGGESLYKDTEREIHAANPEGKS